MRPISVWLQFLPVEFVGARREVDEHLGLIEGDFVQIARPDYFVHLAIPDTPFKAQNGCRPRARQ